MMPTQEIDTPGHTASIHDSHPEHIACYDSSPWVTFANGQFPLAFYEYTLLPEFSSCSAERSEPMAGQLRFASAATTNFTAGLLEATAKMFPSALFSTGGDELNVPCYDQDQLTQIILNSTGETLGDKLQTFVDTVHGGLRKLGKTPVVWEGM